MENTKDYNFFYLNEKETLPLKVLITSSLGEGKYTQEEITKEIEKITLKNTNGKIALYQDDGENFWEVSSTQNNQLNIGNKEDNYAKWDEIKSKVLPIEVEDLLVFCESKENKVKANHKMK